MAKFSRTGYESGASDLGAIVPVAGEYLQPFGNSPNDILTRHRAALEGVDLFPASRIMEAGNRFEDAIRTWFEDEYNVQVIVPTEGYPAPNCNLVASLDGRIRLPDDQVFAIEDHAGRTWELTGDGVIDFKSPTYAPDDPEAPHYMLQLQGQMLCTGATWGILAQLDRARCNWTISVWLAHEGVWAAIADAVNVFWGHMENDTDYPPVDASEASRLVKGNPKAAPYDLSDGPVDDCPITEEQWHQLLELTDTLNKAQADGKNAKKIQDDSKKAIMDIMGGVEQIILPGAKLNWTTTEYKAQPEKITPAKDAYTARRFSCKEI